MSKLTARQLAGISALGEILAEYNRAVETWRPFASTHEGLAVIEEEFEELKAEVFKKPGERSHEKMYIEAKQLAAMCLRFMNDLTKGEPVEAEKS